MNRKINLFALLCLLIGTFLSAQTPGQLTTTRSDQHQKAPGTNIWLVPPKGFKAGVQSSPGFYKDEFNFIAVEELEGSNYNFAYTIRRQVDDAYTFQAEKTYTVNGLNACEVQFFEGGASKIGCHLLVIGNDRFAAIIRFYYRTPETSIEAVGKCLHSVFVDTEKYPDPLAGSGFSIETSRLGYGLVDHDENTFFFAPMDDIPNADSVAALFMVGKIPKPGNDEPSMLTDIHQNVLGSTVDRFEANGANPAPQPATFKDFPALENTVNVKEHGKAARVYVLTVELPDRYYSIMGFARRNLDAEMEKMKRIFQTMTFK